MRKRSWTAAALALISLNLCAAGVAVHNDREMKTTTATAASVYAPRDIPLNTDPDDSFWRESVRTYADCDTFGREVPGHHTTILSRWTPQNLYFLFICHYEKLHLKENPTIVAETNELWNWDVAEVFIGSNFENINRYKEFEVSPQGEWIDLDIDREHPLPENGWKWSSGFEAQGRIDPAAKIWYGAMRIPLAAIQDGPAGPGTRFRVNFYRSQGPPGEQKKISWQPTMSENFHVPARFGLLKLVANK